MARQAAFHRDTVVQGARRVFWRLGFEGASIADLESATGIRRSSLYNAFHSKRGLFDAAVASYLDEVVRPPLAPLQTDEVDPGALAEYLRRLIEVVSDDASAIAQNGCLLINTAREPVAQQPEVASVIAAYRAELSAAVHRGVLAARLQHRALSESAAPAVTAFVIAALALTRVDRAGALENLRSAFVLVSGDEESA